MTNQEKINLVAQSIKASKNSYSVYSGFKVGAALLCDDGSVYLGCNVENASYSATNCAERTAFQTAVADGKRRFKAIAISGGTEIVGETPVSPCGICRQVMSEFCNPETFLILLAHKDGFTEYHLADLLPLNFNLK